ncbi:hypothetical protein MAHJHV51_56750 [Mycobacterium avium subsp. hominissuis]
MSRVAAANPGVTFVGVVERGEVQVVFGDEVGHGADVGVGGDADGAIWARYGVPWQPAYVF